MSDVPQRYDRWKAPPNDGGTLIWPDPDRLLASIADNHRRLSSADAVLLQNTPLSEVRSRLRLWLGNAGGHPIIATGHQAELYHPGVWAKNSLINAAAERVGGSAFHFAVDTDEPKHLILRWPGGSMPLSDADASKAAWSGLLPAPSPAHLDMLAAAIAEASAGWRFRPMLPEFFAKLRPLALEEPTLPAALVNATHALDWQLGLRQHAIMVSPMLSAAPYLLFVHHVLARSAEFAADYNAALADYRSAADIHSPGRPMPNLRISAESVEAPFWLDDLAAATRTRAAVTRRGDRWSLQFAGDAFILDPAAGGWDAGRALGQWLMQHRLRLAPRALTLTAVLRLLVADQFVHGIGGGQYDQVLDGLIARHLKIEPPAFAVTTATLFFPDAVGQPRVCPACLVREGHALKHRAVGFDKNAMVAAIAAAPRRSARRRELFSELHDRLAAATAAAIRRWESDFAVADRQARHERILFDRELFYALQPIDRLASLIRRYREAFGLPA